MKLGCTGHPESYLMVAVDIFLRELRGRWQKANPALSPLAFTAARTLGFLPSRISNDPGLSLACLQHLWGEYGMTAESFPDFEAALVREGLWLWLRRHAARRHVQSGESQHMHKVAAARQ